MENVDRQIEANFSRKSNSYLLFVDIGIGDFHMADRVRKFLQGRGDDGRPRE